MANAPKDCDTTWYEFAWRTFADYDDSPLRVIKKYQDYRFTTMLLAFFFGKMLAHAWNFFIPNSSERAVLKAIIGHEFEQLLARGMARNIPILFTLRSGKIYLGWVVSTADPRRERRWLRILPMAAGYRDELHKPQFVTDYTAILERVQSGEDDTDHLNIADFEIVISVSEIDYAHMHDPTISQEFDKAPAPIEIDPSRSG